jgi:hypothetical protein
MSEAQENPYRPRECMSYTWDLFLCAFEWLEIAFNTQKVRLKKKCPFGKKKMKTLLRVQKTHK